MSVKDVQAAIKKFLATDTPQVLCIRGAWGTGKTYTWQRLVKELRGSEKTIALGQYAYVSLFGINSITELKGAILQNTVQRKQIGDEISENTIRTRLTGAEKGMKALVMRFATTLGENMFDHFVTALSAFSSRQIICIDDLERKGDKLRSVDVLGYISHLKEDRNCKVVLLFNDEQLKDMKKFEAYLEKVVDIYLRFDPTPEEIGHIAITDEDGPLGKMVRDNAIKLGISNVRVIRKLFGLVKEVEPLLRAYDSTVLKTAASTIMLLGWSYFQPKSAPPLVYLKRMNTYMPTKVDEKLDMRWRDVLRRYGYSSTDDFDLLLLKGIENGYFDVTEINLQAAQLHQSAERSTMQTKMQRIWDDYQTSFTIPAEDILDRFHQCYLENINLISIGEMANLEWFFRELGDERSEDLVDRYIEQNRNTPMAFDYDRLRRFGQELPEAVHQKIETARAAQVPILPPQELLKALATRGSDKEIFIPASKLPLEEYVKAMKENEGMAFSDILTGFRQYLNTGGLDPACHTIMDKAGEALREIAKESPINNMRARRLGLIERLEQNELEAAAAAQADDLAYTERTKTEIDLTTARTSGRQDTPPKRGRKSQERPQ
ncbi:UNVERIFIED_ORG: KAP family NTPase [Roseateles sp. XES5]|nr:KAP family NTPase [Roseateles sp. XES5]